MLDLPPVTFCADDLLRGWSPRRIGRGLIVLAECQSTNDAAFEAAREGAVDGLVVLADYQSAGRGRQGRAWFSPRGASVLCSVALHAPVGAIRFQEHASATTPGDSAGRTGQMLAGRLTLAGAVAGCEAIRQVTELAPAIKWPNDLRIAGRKVAGILTEVRRLARGVDVCVLGIGINCLQHPRHFPPELRETITSLEMESSVPIDRVSVARALLERLDDWLAAGELAAGRELHEAWLQSAEPLGQYVRVRSAGRDYCGRTLAVDPAGGLIVQVEERGPMWFDPMLTKLL